MTLPAPALRSWRIVDPPSTPVCWPDRLPQTTSADLERERHRRRLQRRLADLPADLPRHVADALARWWPLEEHRQTELELTVVQPDGRRGKLRLREPRQLVGRGPSCAVRLPSPAVAPEQCVLELAAGRALLALLPGGAATAVNGRPLVPGESRGLAAGDVVDVAPFRLLVGECRSETAKAEIAVTPWRTLLLGTAPRFAALAPAGSLWLGLRCGDWRGYGSLPASFLAFAYRALGYPPPADAGGSTTDLDLALTSFLLRRTAATLGELLGRSVEVTGPLTAAEVETLADPEGSAWGMAVVDLELGGRRSEAAVVWRDGEPADAGAPPPGLDEVVFPVTASCGFTRLGAGSLRQLEPGDVVLPDRWHPGGWPVDGDETGELGEIELVLQGHRRRARLTHDPDGFRIELAAGWRLVPEGEAMTIEEPALEAIPEPEPAAEATVSPAADAAAGPPVPDELEVVLSFELDRISVPLRELRGWREGTALRLSKGPDDRLRILLHQGGGSRVLGYGRALVLDGRVGVEIERWARTPDGRTPEEG